jgi:signal transduction histidine kinase
MLDCQRQLRGPIVAGAALLAPLWGLAQAASPTPATGFLSPALAVLVLLGLVALAAAVGWLVAARKSAQREAAAVSQFASQFATQFNTLPSSAQTLPNAASDGWPEAAAWLGLVATAQHALIVAQRDGPADLWRLRHLNAVAAEALGLSDPSVSHAPWPRVLEALPEALRKALTQGAPSGRLPEAPFWTWHQSERDGTESLLLMRPAASTAASDGVASEAAAEAATFTYALAHDLRAPVRVTEGFSRILKEDYGRQLDRIGNDHLDRVLAAAARMNHMIDALLSMARLSSQPLARHPVDLSQMAQWVIDECRRAWPEREVQVEIEAGMRVVGDPTLLRQLLENLLGNAWKYSAKVEAARIHFGRSGEGYGDRSGGTPAQTMPTFVVADNGAGFDMRNAERLFGLFQRLHSASDFAGTGVGLASVKRIVQRHRGEVWAESAPGEGARFYFTLDG